MDINIECGTGKTGETGERILDCELGRIVNWAQATSLRQRGEEKLWQTLKVCQSVWRNRAFKGIGRQRGILNFELAQAASLRQRGYYLLLLKTGLSSSSLYIFICL